MSGLNLTFGGSGVAAVAGVAVLGALGLYIYKRGGPVAVFDQAAASAVGSAGAVVGLPTPEQTTTDPAVARWLIDSAGLFTASKWSSAGALLRGLMLDTGTGTPPAAGTAAADRFGSQRIARDWTFDGYGSLFMPQADVDAETRRLMDRSRKATP